MQEKTTTKRALEAALALGAVIALAPAPVLADTISTSLNLDTAYRDFVPSAGTTHYTLIPTYCNTAGSLSSSVVGARDSWRVSLASVPAGAIITGVDVQPCASNLTAGASATIDAFNIVNGVQSAYTGAITLSSANTLFQPTISMGGLNVQRGTTTTVEVGLRYASGTGTVKITGLQIRINYTPPAQFIAPSNLTTINVSPNEIQLSWVDNTATETGFRIDRSLNGTNAFSQVALVPPNTTFYRDNRLTADNNYYYRIQAQNTTTGQSTPYSNVSNAITYASVPAVPRNVYLTLGPASITLNWLRLSSNDDGVAIERSTDGATWAEIARTAAGRTTYTDAVNPAGATYYYRARAFNAVGASGYSNIAANVAVPGSGPDLQLGISARQQNQSGAQLTTFSVSYVNNGSADSANAFVTTTVPTGSTFDVQNSSPDWKCHNPAADFFLLQTNIGNALRAFRVRYPNVQQVFISSQMYSGYAVQAGVVEPWAYEGSFAVKAAVEAQIKQVRSGAVDSLVGDLDYRTGRAPWVAQGPFLWANATNANGQGLFYLTSDFGSDMSHPSTAGGNKLAGYMLNYFLSSPYTEWFRNQSDTAWPILPVAPLPSFTPMIDMGASQRYLGLSGGLYPDVSNNIPSDHLSAGMDAATRIQPLDQNGNPSSSGKVVLLGLGFSNSSVVMNAFIPVATADSRVKTQDRNVAPTGFRIVNGAVGGGVANTWADPAHGNYDVVRTNITGLGYSEKQVQAIWFNAANNAGPAIATSLSGTAAGTVCKLPIASIPRGTNGTATFTVRSTFTAPSSLALSASVVDDGATGWDITPNDNYAQISYTVTP